MAAGSGAVCRGAGEVPDLSLGAGGRRKKRVKSGDGMLKVRLGRSLAFLRGMKSGSFSVQNRFFSVPFRILFGGERDPEGTFSAKNGTGDFGLTNCQRARVILAAR